MSKFEEKLIKRELEKTEQIKLNEEADLAQAEFLEEGYDLEAAGKHILGFDKDENKLVKRYDENMAGMMMADVELFKKNAAAMEKKFGKGNLFGDNK